MPQKLAMQLGDGDRHQLRSLIRRGRAAARALTHARILLKIDQELSYEQIAEEPLEISTDTVARVRQRFVKHGLAAALHRRLGPRSLLAEQEFRRPQNREREGADIHRSGILKDATAEGDDCTDEAQRQHEEDGAVDRNLHRVRRLEQHGDSAKFFERKETSTAAWYFLQSRLPNLPDTWHRLSWRSVM